MFNKECKRKLEFSLSESFFSCLLKFKFKICKHLKSEKEME